MTIKIISSVCKSFLRKPSSCFQNVKYLNTTSLKFESNGENNSKKEIAAQKLNALLKTIIEEESQHEKVDQRLEISKPRISLRKKAAAQMKKDKSLGEKIVNAAQEVAKTETGNLQKGDKEYEKQLLQKLLYKDSPLKEEILKASSSLNLSEIIAGMKVEKEEQKKAKSTENFVSRASQVRSALGKQKERMKSQYRIKQPTSSLESIDLFGSKNLGIFDAENLKPDNVFLKTWEQCYDRELHLSVTHPPSNIYEQLIIWTERGILWKFPIDNEQGMEVEKETYFVDHVFLENHLEGWCPEGGPIRHFMELVCVGLSRNHWLTAEEKKEHIMWYKEFFSSRKELIKEIGAGEIVTSTQM